VITISDTAKVKLTEILAEQGDPAASLGLRVYVEPGGCSGFSYGMGIDEEAPRADDQIYETGGLKVYVDSFSSQYLDGAEVDYVDKLMGGGFTIQNPNAAHTCSCGHSFQTADASGTANSCSSH
jgi:iron-sulfur cluster assembly protein